MKFQLIDQVLEQSADRIVAIKQVTAAEEYLADHFPGFPVLPGVLMLEALVQAARRLLAGTGRERHVLGEVKTLRYGSFVRPGEGLRVEVVMGRIEDGGAITFKGSADVVRPETGVGETAVSGRFTMRALQRTQPVAAV